MLYLVPVKKFIECYDWSQRDAQYLSLKVIFKYRVRVRDQTMKTDLRDPVIKMVTFFTSTEILIWNLTIFKDMWVDIDAKSKNIVHSVQCNSR